MLEATDKKLDTSQLRRLKEFGSRVNRFGANFAVCDGNGEMIVLCEGDKFTSSREQLAQAGCRLLEQKKARDRQHKGSEVQRLDDTGRVLGVILTLDHQTPAAVLVDAGDTDEAGTAEQTQTNSEYLREMLELFVENFEAGIKAEQEIDMVSTELAETYEELVLLHKLSTNMRVTELDANFLQMACDSLTEIVNAEGIAILLEKEVDGDKQMVLAAGLGLIDIDERMTADLKSRLMEEINNGKEALLDSEVDSPFRYEWPDSIKNIIAVPLWAKDKKGADLAETSQRDSSIIGIMVAINRVGKADFDSPDVKLLNSVANGCAVFIDNGRLFKDLKELFIGSLKALTSSIDAKDKYTRGHSERVAFISRWIAERIAEEDGLDDEQIHKIYLAGLLHDIGKMGVSEAVLRKEGRLTEQEYDHIKTHPSIGAGILRDIKQMRDIVPGVLCHHERPDGKGYPNGLSGDQIPLVGRIVGLADSFDAMTSKRTYRDAMTIEEALAEIEKGLGTQFDKKAGSVFINSDVYHLWDIMQDGFTEAYRSSNFSEYGTIAIGTLLR
jgi:HD-GYP domain-containing protein (c-di-GMP phosphodiesterase class II)